MHRSSTSVGMNEDSGVNFVDAVLYLTAELKDKVKKSKVFLPTLATCIGTTTEKLLVLDIK